MSDENKHRTLGLRDENLFPVKEIIENALLERFPVYEELIAVITAKPYELVSEWNFYNDGKAWLCKVMHKKKTVFWLSVWDRYFKMTFYFTQKNVHGIASLDIPDHLKNDFNHRHPIGKLIPLTITINQKEQLKDALIVIRYKLSMK
jgi:hypothetical protein